MGVNLAQGLDIGGSSNDRASVCDEFINALFASVEQHVGYEDYNCTGPDRGATGDWRNEFDRAEGILAGIVVGYSLREQYPDHAFLARFRIELEYFYRNSNYAQTAEVGGASGESRDKLA